MIDDTWRCMDISMISVFWKWYKFKILFCLVIYLFNNCNIFYIRLYLHTYTKCTKMNKHWTHSQPYFAWTHMISIIYMQQISVHFLLAFIHITDSGKSTEWINYNTFQTHIMYAESIRIYFAGIHICCTERPHSSQTNQYNVAIMSWQHCYIVTLKW